MTLSQEILIRLLEKETITVEFKNFELNPRDLLECYSYQTLKRIKEIIEDDSLEDKKCFYKIEEIICLYEKLGSNCGFRHDFG